MTNEYNYHTKIMGCDFDMSFIANSVAQADSYFIQTNEIAQLYEKKFSRFDKNSELSILNDKKSLKVSKEFLNVYWTAYHLYKKTSKRFNPLTQVASIGYNKSFEKINKDKLISLQNTKYDTNLDNVIVLKNQIILQRAQELDFGGFLKGYVVQKIVNSIDSNKGMIINIGGDMYAKSSSNDKKEFVVEIVNPLDELKNISFSIMNKALCTSGIYKRKWKTEFGKKHHIVDTKTRDSALTDIISASIICSDASVADAYATLAISSGFKYAINFLKKQRDIDFVLIKTNGDIIKSKGIKL